jgi:plasmid stability protein
MTQISISVPNDIRAYLELRAERHGLSLEMLLRQAVEIYLRAAEAQGKQRKVLQ